MSSAETCTEKSKAEVRRKTSKACTFLFIGDHKSNPFLKLINTLYPVKEHSAHTLYSVSGKSSSPGSGYFTFILQIINFFVKN